MQKLNCKYKGKDIVYLQEKKKINRKSEDVNQSFNEIFMPWSRVFNDQEQKESYCLVHSKPAIVLM